MIDIFRKNLSVIMRFVLIAVALASPYVAFGAIGQGDVSGDSESRRSAGPRTSGTVAAQSLPANTLAHLQEAYEEQSGNVGNAVYYIAALGGHGLTEKASAVFARELARLRELARGSPDEFAGNLASFLPGSRRKESTENLYSEVVKSGTEITEGNSTPSPDHVGEVLRNLANLYRESPSSQDSAAAYSDEDAIYWELVKKSLSYYVAKLALEQGRIAHDHWEKYRYRKAEEALELQLTHFREWATFEPGSSLWRLVDVLSHMGYLYMQTQRTQKAEAYLDEALSIARNLARSRPDRRKLVAETLGLLGDLYETTNRFRAAGASFAEALEIYRGLPKKERRYRQADISLMLGGLAIVYKATGRMKEAEQANKESVSILRRLAKHGSESHRHTLGVRLDNLGNVYQATDRDKKAEAAYEESLSIHRKLAEESKSTHQPNIAHTLLNLGILYRNTERPADAERCFKEALSLYRDLAETESMVFGPRVGMVLNRLGRLYRSIGRMKDAEAAYRQALFIARKQSVVNAAEHEPELALALYNLASLYRLMHRSEAADESISEALEIQHKLRTKNPVAFGNRLARGLSLKARLVGDSNIERACDLAREAQEVALPGSSSRRYAQELVGNYCGY